MKRAGNLTRHTCAICGNPRLARQTWFLVTQDCGLDQLQVWKGDVAFAQNSRADSVCGRRHLRELILHWMTTGCLHYPFAADLRMTTIPNSTPQSGVAQEVSSQQLAEITVERDSIRRVLAENPFSLNVIFEELMIALESGSPDEELYRFDDSGFAAGSF